MKLVNIGDIVIDHEGKTGIVIQSCGSSLTLKYVGHTTTRFPYSRKAVDVRQLGFKVIATFKDVVDHFTKI